MNRHFEFTSTQLKLLLALVIVLVIASSYRIMRSFADTGPEAMRLEVTVGDNDHRYSTVFKVDLNLSPADSLELIPGIGPVLASRIVHFRDSIGRFENIEGIKKVPGIGTVTYNKIKDFIEVRPW
jgi:competence protein ComEA